jgi:hypothetical protein
MDIQLAMIEWFTADFSPQLSDDFAGWPAVPYSLPLSSQGFHAIELPA